MDRLSPEQRKRTMQAVKSKDSKMEITLRKALSRLGYRYRKNHRRIFGTPDIVFVSKKIAIFCDSNFWHGYDWKNKKREIKSNRAFWYRKIERNINRDKEVTKVLRKEGWTVLRFWEHEIQKHLIQCVKIIEQKVSERKK